jgi:hypothetical protein
MNAELLMWLEQVEIWRLQREHSAPKQEDPGQREDEELPVASYPHLEQELEIAQ